MSDHIDELSLQKQIYKRLTPGLALIAAGGTSISVISRGSHNRLAGPDFKNIVVIINGIYKVCDGEVHLDALDWVRHRHHSDPNYQNVLLHFVYNNHELLQPGLINISTHELLLSPAPCEPQSDITPHDETLQENALVRINRKASLAESKIKALGFERALAAMLTDYLQRFISDLKRFPNKINSPESLNPDSISAAREFLLSCRSQYLKAGSLFQYFAANHTKFGKSLSKELFLNVIFPLALVIANQSNKAQLMAWFWSEKSFQKYGKLTRRFKNAPQEYLWQQQGMLEYIYLNSPQN